ncbi:MULTISPECIES: hypothetical protein [unclassified Bosea (in: a-proteobacteria)]|uniref:hypothetical protein n=1 Tax=unclassified Bosea (in: a-proteobacteria) TaxID=2653178 RepID=UPI000F7568D3|nr:MULTISPECIES: hypothetical protein [unclassified Bosea (in: a-proteobacteria)]AZO82086.1 hypothetical protein BLM15_30335 [Bosea sp. Tri-49]RXT24662.1 hypothetical protein B5U98_08460 [Bosea sp. Tri-39]RXT42497.1 hypothetical protein B5U99_00930 [Bosea sp. Tri-54]
MKRTHLIVTMITLLGVPPTLANVPVNDAALLTKQSETAGTTVKLVPIRSQRKEANKGVKCAVTTGKKANVTNPTVQPRSGDGARKIQAYSPESSVTPTAGAKGAALNDQTLFQSAGNVVGGLDASRSTLQAAQNGFRTTGQQIGATDTVMAALDANSSARIQNNLAWNEAINSTNLWVTALNALNLARISDGSRAAGGMRAGSPDHPASTGTVCPAGTAGSGSALDPCRSTSNCPSPEAGTSGDPACVTPRYVDTAGNVLFFLEQTQNAATAASNR